MLNKENQRNKKASISSIKLVVVGCFLGIILIIILGIFFLFTSESVEFNNCLLSIILTPLLLLAGMVFIFIGSKPKKSDDIFYAILTNDTTRVKELLELDPNLLDLRSKRQGYPPLHYAIACNLPPGMISTLLDCSLNCSIKKTTDMDEPPFSWESIYLETPPFHLAALRENSKTIELLANHGLNINLQAKDGSTALTFSCMKNMEKAALLLIKIGADINAADSRRMTPLHYAATRNRLMTKHLIRAGADTEKRNKYGETPLDFAVKKHYLPGIAALLAGGAEWTVTEEKTGELLFEAAKEGEKNLTLALVKKGIDVNIRDKEGKTPLHWCTNRHIAAAILLENGALPNIYDTLGNTPLHYATNRNATKILLDKGADKTIKNNEGKTAYEIIGKPVD